jgi:hypothetical protein
VRSGVSTSTSPARSLVSVLAIRARRNPHAKDGLAGVIVYDLALGFSSVGILVLGARPQALSILTFTEAKFRESASLRRLHEPTHG